MTLTFPPRRRPALLALGATAILACLLWRSITTPDSENSFFCALLLAYSGYTASREARYLNRRETLRLDSRGLIIDHHRFPGWRIRRLPWADVLDQHAAADHLTLIWRDGTRLRETRLNLRHTRNADFTATLARYLPRPVPWPPVTIPLQEPYHWLIGDPTIRTALHQYAPEAIYQPLILVFLAIAALLLSDYNSALATYLIIALIAHAAWRSHRLPQRYRADLPRPYIRLDANGVHYWHTCPQQKPTSRGRLLTPLAANNTKIRDLCRPPICTSPGSHTPTRATCATTACASPCPALLTKTETAAPARVATTSPHTSGKTALPSDYIRPCQR